MTDNATRYDVMVGLNVTDDDMYTRYRQAMKPMLDAHGGWFRYDFRVSEVLKTDSGKPINRLFILTFPDQRARESFFNDPAYQEARKEFFDPSVGSVDSIAAYTRTVET